MEKATISKVSPKVDRGGLPFILVCLRPLELQDDQAAPLTPGEVPFGSLDPLSGIVAGYVAKGGEEERTEGGESRERRRSADGGDY